MSSLKQKVYADEDSTGRRQAPTEHAHGCQNRDIHGLRIDPGLDHGGVEKEPDNVFVGEAAGTTGVPAPVSSSIQARATRTVSVA